MFLAGFNCGHHRPHIRTASSTRGLVVATHSIMGVKFRCPLARAYLISRGWLVKPSAKPARPPPLREALRAPQARACRGGAALPQAVAQAHGARGFL